MSRLRTWANRGRALHAPPVTYAYDAAGNLKSRTDARGVTTTYSYDALNRLIYKSYSDSTPAVTYAYDDGTNGKGHLTGYSNAYSVTGFEFDAMGRIVQSSQITNPSQYVFHYTYNLAGALTTETYPSGRVLTMSRDGADRVEELTGKLGSQQTLYALVNRYAPQGPAEYYTYGNGLVRDQTYNSRMQVVSYYDAIDAQPDYLLFFAYPNWGTTNDNGDLLGETLYEGGPGQLSTLTKFTRNFTYDGANRLTSASDSGGWSRSFKYDQYGNIWVDPNGSSGISTGSMPISNVYDPITNRVVGASYDNAGNQTVVRGDTLTYDAENHMASAYDNVTHNTEYYFYDGMGRRIVKGGPAGRTAYVYDAFGQLAAEYSTVPQDPLCTTCYLSYDLRADVRMVTDQSGNVVARYDYLPFGTEVPANTAGRGSQWGLTGDVQQKFTGQIRDTETGMDYFHARYYGSAFGRFTSPDPKNTGADPTDPQTWNAYAYVRNNPLTLTDPTGTSSCDPNNDEYCVPDVSTDPGDYARWVEQQYPESDPMQGTCIVDGAVTSCAMAFNALQSGGAVQCPNNVCSGFAHDGNGKVAYVQYKAPANGPGSYTPVTKPIPDPSLPQNQAYAAYKLDCQHSTTPCSSGQTVTTRYQGLAGNYAIVGSTLNRASVKGMIPDPSITSNAMHGGPSWYNWSLVNTGHVATNPAGEVESHFDTFSPIFLTPLHFIFDVVPSFFINPKPGVPGPTYTCSLGVGCH